MFIYGYSVLLDIHPVLCLVAEENQNCSLPVQKVEQNGSIQRSTLKEPSPKEHCQIASEGRQVQSQAIVQNEQKPEKDLKPRTVRIQEASSPQLTELSSDDGNRGVATMKEEEEEDKGLVTEEKQHCGSSVPKVGQNCSTQRSMLQVLSRKEHCQTTPEGRHMQLLVTFQPEQRPEKDMKTSILQNQQVALPQLIELSSDDDDGNNIGFENTEDKERVAIGETETETEDEEKSVWHFVGPDGDHKGPVSLSLLKRWAELSSYALKFKAWKDGQSEESAIQLSDAIGLTTSQK